jgi:WXG100 family type VII secretion target
MSYIKVTGEQLGSVATQLNNAASNINEVNTSAMSQVNGLAGLWEGQAHAQFEALFTSWKAGSDQVQQALAGISQLLTNAQTSYANTEAGIAQSMSQG